MHRKTLSLLINRALRGLCKPITADDIATNNSISQYVASIRHLSLIPLCLPLEGQLRGMVHASGNANDVTLNVAEASVRVDMIDLRLHLIVGESGISASSGAHSADSGQQSASDAEPVEAASTLSGLADAFTASATALLASVLSALTDSSQVHVDRVRIAVDVDTLVSFTTDTHDNTLSFVLELDDVVCRLAANISGTTQATTFAAFGLPGGLSASSKNNFDSDDESNGDEDDDGASFLEAEAIAAAAAFAATRDAAAGFRCQIGSVRFFAGKAVDLASDLPLVQLMPADVVSSNGNPDTGGKSSTSQSCALTIEGTFDACSAPSVDFEPSAIPSCAICSVGASSVPSSDGGAPTPAVSEESASDTVAVLRPLSIEVGHLAVNLTPEYVASLLDLYATLCQHEVAPSAVVEPSAPKDLPAPPSPKVALSPSAVVLRDTQQPVVGTDVRSSAAAAASLSLLDEQSDVDPMAASTVNVGSLTGIDTMSSSTFMSSSLRQPVLGLGRYIPTRLDQAVRRLAAYFAASSVTDDYVEEEVEGEDDVQEEAEELVAATTIAVDASSGSAVVVEETIGLSSTATRVSSASVINVSGSSSKRATMSETEAQVDGDEAQDVEVLSNDMARSLSQSQAANPSARPPSPLMRLSPRGSYNGSQQQGQPGGHSGDSSCNAQVAAATAKNPPRVRLSLTVGHVFVAVWPLSSPSSDQQLHGDGGTAANATQKLLLRLDYLDVSSILGFSASAWLLKANVDLERRPVVASAAGAIGRAPSVGSGSISARLFTVSDVKAAASTSAASADVRLRELVATAAFNDLASVAAVAHGWSEFLEAHMPQQTLRLRVNETSLECAASSAARTAPPAMCLSFSIDKTLLTLSLAPSNTALAVPSSNTSPSLTAEISGFSLRHCGSSVLLHTLAAAVGSDSAVSLRYSTNSSALCESFRLALLAPPLYAASGKSRPATNMTASVRRPAPGGLQELRLLGIQPAHQRGIQAVQRGAAAQRGMHRGAAATGRHSPHEPHAQTEEEEASGSLHLVIGEVTALVDEVRLKLLLQLGIAATAAASAVCWRGASSIDTSPYARSSGAAVAAVEAGVETSPFTFLPAGSRLDLSYVGILCFLPGAAECVLTLSNVGATLSATDSADSTDTTAMLQASNCLLQSGEAVLRRANAIIGDVSVEMAQQHGRYNLPVLTLAAGSPSLPSNAARLFTSGSNRTAPTPSMVSPVAVLLKAFQLRPALNHAMASTGGVLFTTPVVRTISAAAPAETAVGLSLGALTVQDPMLLALLLFGAAELWGSVRASVPALSPLHGVQRLGAGTSDAVAAAVPPGHRLRLRASLDSTSLIYERKLELGSSRIGGDAATMIGGNAAITSAVPSGVRALLSLGTLTAMAQLTGGAAIVASIEMAQAGLAVRGSDKNTTVVRGTGSSLSASNANASSPSAATPLIPLVTLAELQAVYMQPSAAAYVDVNGVAQSSSSATVPSHLYLLSQELHVSLPCLSLLPTLTSLAAHVNHDVSRLAVSVERAQQQVMAAATQRSGAALTVIAAGAGARPVAVSDRHATLPTSPSSAAATVPVTATPPSSEHEHRREKAAGGRWTRRRSGSRKSTKRHHHHGVRFLDEAVIIDDASSGLGQRHRVAAPTSSHQRMHRQQLSSEHDAAHSLETALGAVTYAALRTHVDVASQRAKPYLAAGSFFSPYQQSEAFAYAPASVVLAAVDALSCTAYLVAAPRTKGSNNALSLKLDRIGFSRCDYEADSPSSSGDVCGDNEGFEAGGGGAVLDDLRPQSSSSLSVGQLLLAEHFEGGGRASGASSSSSSAAGASHPLLLLRNTSSSSAMPAGEAPTALIARVMELKERLADSSHSSSTAPPVRYNIDVTCVPAVISVRGRAASVLSGLTTSQHVRRAAEIWHSSTVSNRPATLWPAASDETASNSAPLAVPTYRLNISALQCSFSFDPEDREIQLCLSPEGLTVSVASAIHSSAEPLTFTLSTVSLPQLVRSLLGLSIGASISCVAFSGITVGLPSAHIGPVSGLPAALEALALHYGTHVHDVELPSVALRLPTAVLAPLISRWWGQGADAVLEVLERAHEAVVHAGSRVYHRLALPGRSLALTSGELDEAYSYTLLLREEGGSAAGAEGATAAEDQRIAAGRHLIRYSLPRESIVAATQLAGMLLGGVASAVRWALSSAKGWVLPHPHHDDAGGGGHQGTAARSANHQSTAHHHQAPPRLAAARDRGPAEYQDGDEGELQSDYYI